MSESNISPHLVGLEATLDQVQHILKEYAPILYPCSDMREAKTGFNNKVYFLTCATEGEVVFRITKETWRKEKTSCEVVGLEVVAMHTSLTVPKIIAWCDEAKPFNYRWIIMDKLQGLQVTEEIFNNLSETKQHCIMNQAVSVLKELQAVPMNDIGGFYKRDVNAGVEADNIYVGPYFEDDLGPYKSCFEYECALLCHSIQKVKTFELYADFKQFLPKCESLLLKLKHHPASLGLDNLPTVLFHGDLKLQNLLFTENPLSKDLKLSGVVDWEWVGAFPSFKEWQMSILMEDSLLAEIFRQEAIKENVLQTEATASHKYHWAVMDIWENIIPWQLGCLSPVNDDRYIKEAFKQLNASFRTLGL